MAARVDRAAAFILVAATAVFLVGVAIAVPEGIPFFETDEEWAEYVAESPFTYGISLSLVAAALLLAGIGLAGVADRIGGGYARAAGRLALVVGAFGAIDYGANVPVGYALADAWKETGGVPEWITGLDAFDDFFYNAWEVGSYVAMLAMGAVLTTRGGAHRPWGVALLVVPWIGYFVITIPAGVMLTALVLAFWALRVPAQAVE